MSFSFLREKNQERRLEMGNGKGKMGNGKGKGEKGKSCEEGEEEERNGCWKGEGFYAKSRGDEAVCETIFVDGG